MENMKTGIVPLVIGNWKMNPHTRALSIKLGSELKKKIAKIRNVEIVIAPPFVYLDGVEKTRGSNKTFFLGAQDVHYEKLGAYTGSISIPMLQEFGVTHVIVGHSERRKVGETDESVNQKLVALIKVGVTAVVCVGEEKRDHGAHYLSHIEMQVRKALATIPRSKLNQVVIAYEPIWAIGTGNTATVEDVHEMKLFIEKILSDLYGRNYAQKVRILYGGSVNRKNAQELYTHGMVHGFLIGGASLDAEEFTQIISSIQPTV